MRGAYYNCDEYGKRQKAERGRTERKLPTEQKFMFGSLAVTKMKLFNIFRAVDEMSRRTSIQMEEGAERSFHSMTFYFSRNAQIRINFIAHPRQRILFPSPVLRLVLVSHITCRRDQMILTF